MEQKLEEKVVELRLLASRDRLTGLANFGSFDAELGGYFESVLAKSETADPSTVANWVTGEIFSLLNQAGIGIDAAPVSPQALAGLLGALRRRARYVEETNLECRLAASIADEAVAATHVRMALEIAGLLAEECTPDEAIMHYVRSFDIPAIDAQLIFRRAMACWAERDPLGLDRVEPVTPTLTVCATPQLDFGGRFRLGLRAIS
mgnify:CR=1 FL=1